MPRPITAVNITPDFEKAYLRLPKHIQNLATRKDQWFRKDAFDPRLRTHKLKGNLSSYWAYSVNREYRVLFRFLGPNEVLLRGAACIADPNDSNGAKRLNGLNDWNVWNRPWFCESEAVEPFDELRAGFWNDWNRFGNQCVSLHCVHALIP